MTDEIDEYLKAAKEAGITVGKTIIYHSLNAPEVVEVRDTVFQMLQEKFPEGCSDATAFVLFVTGLNQLMQKADFDPHQVLEQVIYQLKNPEPAG